MGRTLYYIALCILIMFACVFKSKAQCPAATALVIHSVTATESRCEATGTATVLVSGGSTPYTYSIITGPTLVSPQSSNMLLSLAPGNYTVLVTDNCNTSVTRSFTVAGSYAVPSLNITTQSPNCSAGSDGSITINVTDGRAPLVYSLINPSPVTRGPQAGNAFAGLPAGTYTCQVTDSCGNFQTRTATINVNPSSVTVSSGTIRYLDCDSFAVTALIGLTNFKPPYTITATAPDGKVFTHVLTAPNLNSGGGFADIFPVKYRHIPGGNQTLLVTATNSCGVTNSASIDLDPGFFEMLPLQTALPGCGGQFAYSFEASPSLHCNTVTYTLVSPSGAVLATQTNNSTFSGFTPASGYKVVREDCCGKDSVQFNWAGGTAFAIVHALPFPEVACKEGTTGLQIFFNFNNRQGDIVVASGPPSITWANGSVHPLHYPDTIKNVQFNQLVLHYFTVGTYEIQAITSCGEQDNITVTIEPWDVRHSAFSASLEKGCSGANKILLSASSNVSLAPGAITVNSIYNKNVRSSPFSDSLTNLSPGTYNAVFHYQKQGVVSPAFLTGMSGWTCDVITNTIVVPAYTQPIFNSAAAIALCGATRQAALLPDSTRGLAPYQFQIIAGPITTPMQASPEFTGLARGTYTFLMADACANSYSRSITIDTLAIPNVVGSGNTCIGGAASLSMPSSPFFNYTWQHPNGSVSTGNTIALNPVSASDMGTYTISVTSTVGGCTSNNSKNFMLTPCLTLGQKLLHFSGQRKNGNIQLNWQTADEINMSYYTVERSTDGIVFKPVQRVAATGKEQNTYTATDTHVPAGIVYYRLQPVENNGNISYSSIISFNNGNSQPFNVYPNLITSNTPVTVTCPVNSHTTYIRIIGVDGKVWRNIPVAAGATKTSIDVTAMARGSYFVVLTGNDNVVATQVWKE